MARVAGVEIVLQGRGQAVATRGGSREPSPADAWASVTMSRMGVQKGAKHQHVVAGIEHRLEGDVKGMRSAGRSR